MVMPDATETDQCHMKYWAMLCGLSLVNLTSLTNQFLVSDDMRSKEWMRAQRWMVSVAAISFATSFLSVFFHMFAAWFHGSYFEWGKSFVLLILWAAVLPTLLDHDSIEVVDKEFGVVNGNAFFSGWGCFFYSLMLFASQSKKHSGYVREDHKTWFHWTFFSAASLVVLCSSAIHWRDDMCKDLEDGGAVCSRSMLGIVLGTMSFVTGLGMMFQPDSMVDRWVSVVAFIAWCFGVAFINYNEGHGTMVNSLYFATWICMFLSLSVASMSIWDWMKERNTVAEAGDAAEDKAGSGDAKGGDGDNEEEEVAEP